MFDFLDKIIDFIKKYWWAAVLAALVCWSAALLYFTLWPPETAMEKQVRLRAGFLEPKQAKDLDEAEDLLTTVNLQVRELPRDVILYRHIIVLMAYIGNGEFTPEQKQEAERNYGMKWDDLRSNWLGETASLLGLSEEQRPADLKEAAEKLSEAKKRIEKENSEGFNKTLEGLLDDLKKNRSRGGLLETINKFLANDVVEIARQRLITMGTPAVPTLAKMLEENPNSAKGKRVYEVILNIIAETRLASLDPADLPKEVEALQKEFGAEPDAKAIANVKEWLDSPANRELLGK